MVSYIRHPGAQPPCRTVAHFAGERMNFDFHFGNSQEHCMKKLVFASAMALASISLVSTPALRAQDAGQITIQDPAEFNAYQNASTQTDPAQKCPAVESFLTDLSAERGQEDGSRSADRLLPADRTSRTRSSSAATRLLQVDPNNMKAIFISVYVKKQQCGKSLDASGVSTDPQTCDDAAALAQKGLSGCQAGRHVGRRLEESDRRRISRSSTRPSRLTTSFRRRTSRAPSRSTPPS